MQKEHLMIMTLIFLFLLLFVFFGTFWLVARHCKKIGVSFKDFYFGTKRYDKALKKNKL